jgi:hypothetical protein
VLEADDAAPELLLEEPAVELGSAPGSRDSEVVDGVLVKERDLAVLVMRGAVVVIDRSARRTEQDWDPLMVAETGTAGFAREARGRVAER